jgi:hypothetical protein
MIDVDIPKLSQIVADDWIEGHPSQTGVTMRRTSSGTSRRKSGWGRFMSSALLCAELQSPSVHATATTNNKATTLRTSSSSASPLAADLPHHAAR